MAKMRLDIRGLEEVQKKFDNLGLKSVGIVKMGHYDGMKVIADEYKKQIRSLPTQQKYNGMPPFVPFEASELTGLSSYAKRDLEAGIGTSRIDFTGHSTKSKVGETGYGSVPTKKYPKGVPNILLMRALNKGAMNKKGFVRAAVPVTNRTRNAARSRAKEEVNNTILREIKKEL